MVQPQNHHLWRISKGHFIVPGPTCWSGWVVNGSPPMTLTWQMLRHLLGDELKHQNNLSFNPPLLEFIQFDNQFEVVCQVAKVREKQQLGFQSHQLELVGAQLNSILPVDKQV